MSRKLHIIGLCGPDAIGRAAVAGVLATYAGFRQLSFLDALHSEIAEGFHIDGAAFNAFAAAEPVAELALARCLDSAFCGAAAKHLAIAEPHAALSTQISKPRTPAEILTLWGRAYRHRKDPAYWIRPVRSRISYYIRDLSERCFVVDGVRFEDEAQALRDMGGTVWHVCAPGQGGDAYEWSDLTLNGQQDLKHLRQLVLGEYWARDAGLDSVRVEIAA